MKNLMFIVSCLCLVASSTIAVAEVLPPSSERCTGDWLSTTQAQGRMNWAYDCRYNQSKDNFYLTDEHNVGVRSGYYPVYFDLTHSLGGMEPRHPGQIAVKNLRLRSKT